MDTQPKSAGQFYECALRWLEACRHAAARKTAALMQNDLIKLEECLEAEGDLISQYSELKVMISAKELFAQEGKPAVALALPGHSLTGLAAEVSSVNRRNSVLIETGLDFSRTLLSVMRPPVTYGQAGQVDAATRVGPGQPIFSVEC